MKANKIEIFTIIFVCLCATLVSCGKNTRFSVDAEIDGVGTQNLKAVWRTAPDGVLNLADITAVGNAFKFSGNTMEPTLVEVYTAHGTQLMCFMVQGGDKIRLRGLSSDLRVSGSDVGMHFAEVMARINEEADRNAAVADWIAANPADAASAVLLVTVYEPKGREAQADSLLGLLDSVGGAPAWLVRDWAESLHHSPVFANDTVGEFRAFTSEADTFELISGRHLYVLTENNMQRTQALIDSMRSWSEREDGPEVVDVYFGSDRSAWITTIEPDSASWTQIIMPGGVAAPAFKGLNIEKTPLMIETDSLGAVISRTTL